MTRTLGTAVDNVCTDITRNVNVEIAPPNFCADLTERAGGQCFRARTVSVAMPLIIELNLFGVAERLHLRGRYSDLRDSALVFAVSMTICIVFCFLAVIPVLKIQYATFVLSVLGRSFVYSLTASGTSLL